MSNTLSPTIMARDNLTYCYEAIQRVYRNSIVRHLREVLTQHFGKDAVEQVKKHFKKEWNDIEAAAYERRETNELSSPIIDPFDILGVNHFYNLYNAHFQLLYPDLATKSDRAQKQSRQALLGWMKSIKNLRDSMSHPAETDFDVRDAQNMLYCARKALESLKLHDAAQEVSDIRRQLDGKARATDKHVKRELLQKTIIDGRRIHYLDNKATSNPDILIFYLHGLGLDCRDFYPAMDSRYRSVAPTMAGFHPGDTHTASIDLARHCDIFSSFFEHHIKRLEQEQQEQVSTIIIVGFSIGADLSFQMLREANWIKNRKVGLLCLDCNINTDTCFISKELWLSGNSRYFQAV